MTAQQVARDVLPDPTNLSWQNIPRLSELIEIYLEYKTQPDEKLARQRIGTGVDITRLLSFAR